MSDLVFRIIFVPKENLSYERKIFLLKVKNAVKICGLNVTSINYSQVKKSEDEDYPEIEELSIQIQAVDKTLNPRQKILQYKKFCSRWINQFSSFPISYVVLYGNDCFSYPKHSHITDAYKKFCFGVLPHNGIFYEYASLTRHMDSVDFYHDTRNVIITYGNFEVKFSYDNIRAMFVDIKNSCEVYLDLFNPPKIFRIETKRFKQFRHRNLDMKHPGFTKEGIDADILGRSNVLLLHFTSPDRVEEIIAGIHFNCSEKSVHYSRISSFSKDKPMDPVIESMHFGCTYLLTAIFKRNFIAVSQASDIDHNLLKLKSFSRQSPDSLEKALTTVLSALDSGKILNFWNAIERQYNYYISNRDEINFKEYIVPSKCSMIRRVTLTPTRVLLWPAEIMYGNRVLRNYDSEYSIRVSFRDDNMTKMSYDALYADDGVLDSCIKAPMTRGLRIGSRHYDFLAWSNSQIRDHGVWMYAQDLKGNTAAFIRSRLGDFSHIRNVPKYMARIGQCFSQTEDALSVPLDSQHVRTEMDIEGGCDVNYKPYCFSDGVGRISSELTAKVHNKLGHDKLCSAFQIRYGGYKGMLVTDPTLKDTQIVFRKSMQKFDSPQHTKLEIAQTSAPVHLQLNRPLIALLHDLGVRDRIFMRLQEEMLKTLTDMLYNEKEAAEFLKSKTPINLFNYKDLSDSGIHLTTEPFFKHILLALHRHHIDTIKRKANITIDPSKGRNMLGVMDETGILNYGQVFVQYTTDISYGETTKDTTILRGEVLVTKNPCLFPGDVRKFQAVDVPQLHHIVDCLVFPQKGPRPHSNEMAGSDMDGDEYSVLWMKDLIFKKPNHAAAKFPEVNAQNVSHVTVSHMIEFLQTYIKNDQVGQIASAHLVHADDQGVFSNVCLTVAKKFSVAVDFAKSGKTEQLDKSERPMKYPDFMENSRWEMYSSTKALGKMYRICKDFESENQEFSISYQNIEVDPDLKYFGWEKYKDSAVKSRNKYNGLFRSVLRNYGIQHEAEALSGAFTKLHCRFQERKDKNEIEKVVIGCIKKLHKSMLEEFLEEFSGSANVVATQNRMLQKASAWYIVTYSDPNAKFLSFPWTVSKYLANIKLRRTFVNRPHFSPAIVCLDKKILECESKKLLPDYVKTGIWHEYRFLCDALIVRRALQTLILWAQDEEIIEAPEHGHQGLLYVEIFIKLFLHAADKLGYITPRYSDNNDKKTPCSSGQLCLEFLKFCSSLRLYLPTEIPTILPFPLYKYTDLAKKAVVSYHRFALSGVLRNLYFDMQIKNELIQMKPMHIDNKIFLKTPIDKVSLEIAKYALIKYSKVNYLSLREIRQTNKVCVSARGSEGALKELKSILQEKHIVLRQLFSTGVMPAKPIN